MVSDLLAAAAIIKEETGLGKNTHVRIGAMFEAIINYFATNVSDEATTKIEDIVKKYASGLQKGMSVRWDLNLGAIPTGFVLNNGNGGVKINGVTIPDDRRRFTVGYDPAKAVLPADSIDLTENYGKVGNTGGVNSITLKSTESGSPEKSIEVQLYDPWSDNGAAVFGSGEVHSGHANGKGTISIPAANAADAHENRPLYITVCWITKVSDDTTPQYNSAYQSYVSTTTDNPVLEEAQWVARVEGVGIASIELTNTVGLVDTYTITYTDTTTSTYEVTNGGNGNPGSNGRGITSIARTSGNGNAGTTDTYTITFTDTTTTTFTVVNGANGNNGYTPQKGTDYFDGDPGTSVPVNLAIFKPSANAIALPVGFKWINNITVTSVQLMTNCSGISVTIGANTYNQTTLIGVTLTAGTEMIINDLTIVAGQTNANAIIIF